MNHMRRDGVIYDLTDGFRQPEPPPYTERPPVPVGHRAGSHPPAMFGTREAFTRAMDALATEITTVRGLRTMKDEVFALYDEVDEAIARDDNPLTQGRKVRWSLKAEAGIEARTERYLNRGLSVTEDNLTIRHTYDNGGYR